MDRRQSFEMLRSLIKALQTGDPVPLHWAVTHADTFTAAWLFTVESFQLLEIATLVMPRDEVVRALCALIRDRCPSLNQEPRAIDALEVMEGWADGRAISSQAILDAGEILRPLADGSNAALPFTAVFCACGVPCSAVGNAASYASTVGGAIQAMTAATDDAEQRTAIADFVRQQFMDRDILADVMQANRRPSPKP